MRGSKAKNLRRICWTDKPNRRNRTIKELKREYAKGVPTGLMVYYPRKGRDWRHLLRGDA